MMMIYIAIWNKKFFKKKLVVKIGKKKMMTMMKIKK